MNHALVKLARAIDWGFLEQRFGLAILKHTHDLSDEALCERWIENPYYQHFCGEEFFQHQLPWTALH
jgi:transposase, IS5 family